jgi:hypothetical protein
MAWKAWQTFHIDRHIAPHQMPAAVEVQLLEMRRAKPYWGARRLAVELARKGIRPAPADADADHGQHDKDLAGAGTYPVAALLH